VKIRPYGEKWRADAGMVLGRRTQKVFDKKVHAELWLRSQDRVRQDTKIGIRRISQAREQIAALAFDYLDKHGFEQEMLLDAVRRFCAVASPGKPTPLLDALKGFERDLHFANRSPVYVEQITRQLNRFLRDFSDRKMHEITSEEIFQWLSTNCASPSNRSNRRRELKVFFSWAVRQGIITENPIDRIPRITVDRGRPEILTVPQVRSALENLEGQDRALFAVMVFAGLRPSEAEALQWEDIKLDRGFLEAKRGFRADNRNVRLSDNLVDWLEPLRTEGLVFKGHTRRWRDRVQRAISTDAEALPVWPQDVLRHSFGSYHLEKHKDAVNTAHEMGHRGNPRMLYAHYRELVTPEAAEEFWKIIPPV
jgi:integrase